MVSNTHAQCDFNKDQVQRLYDRAWEHVTLNQLDKTDILFDSIIAITKNCPSDSTRRYIISQKVLMYLNQMRFEDAAIIGDSLIPEMKKAGRDASLQGTIQHTALAHRNQFRIQKSIMMLEALIADRLNYPDTNLSTFIFPLSYLGASYIYTDTDKALDIFRRMLAVQFQDSSHVHYFRGLAYNNLSQVYNKQGQYELEESYLIKAIEEYKLHSLPLDELIAISYSNLGNCYLNKNQFDAGESAIKKAIRMNEGLHEKQQLLDLGTLGLSYLKLGLIQIEQQKDLDTVRKSLEKAVSYFEQQYDHEWSGIHYAYSVLGNYLSLNNETEEAEKFLLKGAYLSAWYSLEIHDNLSNHYIRNEDYKRALTAIDTALFFEKNGAFGGENSLGKISNANERLTYLQSKKAACLFHLYESSKNKKYLKLAYGLARESLKEYDKIKARINNYQDLIRVQEDYESLSNLFIKMSVDIYQEDHSEKVLTDSYQIIDHNRMGILQKLFIRGNGGQGNFSEHDRLRQAEMRIQLKDLQSQIQEAKRQKRFSKADSLKIQFANLDQVYQVRYRQLFGEVQNMSHTPDNLHDIKKGAYVVEFHVDTLAQELIRFLISKDGIQVHRKAYSADLINKTKQFNRMVKSPHTGNAIEYQKIAHELYQYLLDDLLPSDAQHITINAHLFLHFLPFDALVYETISQPSFKHLKYLIKKYDLSSNSRPFHSKTRKTNEGYIAFAPVEFETRNSLPFSLNELLKTGDLSTHSLATESRFKNKIKRQSKIVHLATHGILDDKNPLNSHLLFHPDEQNDGQLFSYEIFGLEMDVDLLILSSCNSGSGYIQSGEGILSLAKAFQFAGSKSLLFTLWEVDDQANSLLIKHFLSFLEMGLSKDVALKKAKMAYLQNAHDIKSHPYYWASSQISGELNPIYNSPKSSEEKHTWKYYLFGSILLIVILALFIKLR